MLISLTLMFATFRDVLEQLVLIREAQQDRAEGAERLMVWAREQGFASGPDDDDEEDEG